MVSLITSFFLSLDAAEVGGELRIEDGGCSWINHVLGLDVVLAGDLIRTVPECLRSQVDTGFAVDRRRHGTSERVGCDPFDSDRFEDDTESPPHVVRGVGRFVARTEQELFVGFDRPAGQQLAYRIHRELRQGYATSGGVGLGELLALRALSLEVDDGAGDLYGGYLRIEIQVADSDREDFADPSGGSQHDLDDDLELSVGSRAHPILAATPGGDLVADSLHLLDRERRGTHPWLVQAPGLRNRISGNRVVPSRQAERQAEHDLGVLRTAVARRRLTLEELVDPVHADLAQRVVLEGIQDQGAHVALVGVLGRRCQPRVLCHVLDPEFHKFREGGVSGEDACPGSMIAPARDTPLELSFRSRPTAPCGFDAPEFAVPVAEPCCREVHLVDRTDRDFAEGADGGAWPTHDRSPRSRRLGAFCEPAPHFADREAQLSAEAMASRADAGHAPVVDALHGYVEVLRKLLHADEGLEALDVRLFVHDTEAPGKHHVSRRAEPCRTDVAAYPSKGRVERVSGGFLGG